MTRCSSIQSGTRWFLPLWLALIRLLSPLEAAQGAPARSLVTTIQRVSDGDTVTAVTDNQAKLRICLFRIDAPGIVHGTEPGQPVGEKAREYLDHLIGGKTVKVKTYGPDRYKRVLAVIWDDQINVNLLMVAMGYAEVYRGAPCKVYCRELEQAEGNARRDRVGMWAQSEKYESPRDFRRRMRTAGKVSQAVAFQEASPRCSDLLVQAKSYPEEVFAPGCQGQP